MSLPGADKAAARQLARQWWLALAGTAALVLLALAGHLTTRLDNAFYDALIGRARQPADAGVLLVAIDERSLQQLGPWPWPRSLHARLLRQLAAGGAQAVALDILFVEPTRPEEDAALAQAMRAGPPAFLPVEFEVPGRDGAPFTLARPIPLLAEAAAGLGHVNLAPDADGTTRRLYLAYQGQGHSWPQLASMLAGARGGTAAAGADLHGTAPVLLRYAGPRGSFPTVSAASLLAGEVPPAMIAGKLVIIGATAAGLGDSYATPASADGSLMPGIEIQANLLATLRAGRGIAPAGWEAGLAFALAPLLLLMLALRLLPPRWMLVAAGLLVAGVVALSAGLLLAGDLWLAPAPGLLGMALAYPLWTWRRLMAVSHYLSAELEKLDAESDPLERPRPPLPEGDVVARQMGLLRSAIDRERDLRHFLVERIAQMPDAVLVCDLAGAVVLANQGACDLAQALGAQWAGPGAHAAPLLACFTRTGEAPGPLDLPLAGLAEGWEGAVEAAGGRSFALRAEPQRNAENALVGQVLRIVETSEQVAMQRQREDVLQLLSHDMRAPQAAIIALLEQQGAALPEGLAAQIAGHAGRTLAMADNFVHLSRAELMVFEPEPVDLCAIAQDAADALWPRARQRGVEVVTTLPDDELWVAGEASLLARALINLLDNAVKFAPAGATVNVTVAAAGGMACAHVANPGPPIPPAQMARLFERFTRAGSGPARKADGVGLGLAFVHRVATRLGGTIACTSDAAQGTCFTLTLPRLPD